MAQHGSHRRGDGAHRVLFTLDNMTLDQLREAVQRRNRAGSGILLEASGGVSFQTLRGIAETGVDRISIGALTHSSPALDIGRVGSRNAELTCASNTD